MRHPLETLAGELTDLQTKLDELAARIARRPAEERDLLEPKLIHLRDLWNEAQFSFNVGRATGGKLRSEDEEHCQLMLDEAKTGFGDLTTEVDAHH